MSDLKVRPPTAKIETSSPLQATPDNGQEGNAPHATAACGAPEQSICSEIVTLKNPRLL